MCCAFIAISEFGTHTYKCDYNLPPFYHPKLRNPDLPLEKTNELAWAEILLC